MLRSATIAFAIAVFCALPVMGQSDAPSLENYFTGKEVLIKIDMPGSQKGIDLKFNKSAPMDWKDYSSRIKSFGISIRKGDVARVTQVVVKKDMIEFQLDGGGFGTARDDSTTTVAAQPVEKSDYEKNLEKQIANTTDDDKKRSLQRDLDRERSRRERQEAANRSDAQIASQIKSQQVADNRVRGGSRFNLRWQGSIPSDQRSPDAVMKLLAEYVDFNPAAASGGPVTANADAGDGGSPTSRLKQGMKIDEVASLLGQGKLISESVSNDGLKTQVFEYNTEDRKVNVTSVNGVVVHFSISSK